MKKDSTLYVAIFMFTVSIAFVLPLALANELTKPAVTENMIFASRKAVLDAFGILWTSRTHANSQYESRIVEHESNGSKAWKTVIDGSDHVAIEYTGAGVWGPITIILAADKEVTRLDGMTVLFHSETPGLGGRIDEEWFREQFRKEQVGAEGIRITTGTEALGRGDTDKDNLVLDGITGASRTTQAMEALVNGALRELRTFAGAAK